MIVKTINLKEYYKLTNDVTLECYIIKNSNEMDINRKRKAMLILPGGGYHSVSDREATPIALKFLANDITSFVLRYSTNGFQFPTQMLEVFAAIDYITKNKNELNIDNISLCGFSAGGHLAGITAKLIEEKKYLDMIGVSNLNLNGIILSYPVLDFVEYAHEGTRDEMTKDKNLYEFLSVQRNLKKFPKAFIWHTLEDTVVHPMNSILLSQKLIELNSFHELHLLPKGIHGLSLANEITTNKNYPSICETSQKWIDLCLEFIKNHL